MQFDHTARHGESDAEVTDSAASASEKVEYARQSGGLDPLARVAHRNGDAAEFVTNRNLDPAAIRREFYGVSNNWHWSFRLLNGEPLRPMTVGRRPSRAQPARRLRKLIVASGDDVY